MDKIGLFKAWRGRVPGVPRVHDTYAVCALHSGGISAFNSAIIELNQLLVSAKVIQLKGAGETNLLQMELVDVL